MCHNSDVMLSICLKHYCAVNISLIPTHLSVNAWVAVYIESTTVLSDYVISESTCTHVIMSTLI